MKFKILSFLVLFAMLFTNCSSTENEDQGLGTFEIQSYNDENLPLDLKLATILEGTLTLDGDGKAFGEATIRSFDGETFTISVSAPYAVIGNNLHFEFPSLGGEGLQYLGRNFFQELDDFSGRLSDDTIVITYNYRESRHGLHRVDLVKR